VILRNIESKGLQHTACRIKQRCSRVFRHAIGLGCLTHDATEGLRGLLEPLKVRHHPSIRDPQRLGGLLLAIDSYKGRAITGIALKLAPLLFSCVRENCAKRAGDTSILRMRNGEFRQTA
jgi:hypothetical protein